MAGESARERALGARARSARMARYAELYERGADGEVETAAVLDQLGPAWERLDDMHWPGRPYANIDHVLVGPPGVFVIDTKNWSGNLDIGPDKIRQNGYSRKLALDGSQLAAREIGLLLDPAVREHTMPMLCFVRDAPIRGMVGKVMVCSTSNIVARLESMAPVLAPHQVRYATDQLHMSLSAAIEPVNVSARTPRPRAGGQTKKSAGAVVDPSKRPASRGARLVPEAVATIVVLAAGLYVAGHAVDIFTPSDTARHQQPTNDVKPADKDATLQNRKPAKP